MRLKKYLILPITLAVVLTQTACPRPTQSQLDQAAKASRSMAQYTNDGINAVRIAYEEGVIDIKLKDRLADGFLVVAKGGQAFNSLVKQVSELYGDGTVPVSQWQALDASFSDNVVRPFLDLLQSASGLSGEKSAKIRAIIAGLRTAVLVISEVFGKRATLERKVDRIELALGERRNLCLA